MIDMVTLRGIGGGRSQDYYITPEFQNFPERSGLHLAALTPFGIALFPPQGTALPLQTAEKTLEQIALHTLSCFSLNPYKFLDWWMTWQRNQKLKFEKNVLGR
ncbi:MAG: hypothetical protein HN366_03560 [Deltaproteobacteria bacterium]|jgi:hypothetical protein|nr:hypothetical protein [Deltaproteobacteria bacterium]